MRRLSAISLLGALFYLLIAPALFADPESSLAECCRRNGAHHCVMGSNDSGAAGASLRSIRCPTFPAATSVPAGAAVTMPRNSSTIIAALVIHPSIQRQTEVRHRASFSRSRQKRGPPAFSPDRS